MKKEAFKPSTDPNQNALRKSKDDWNHAASLFISKVIAFKRAMNGRGDAHFGLPTGKIQDPLPSQVTSFLSTLSSDFEHLASEALKIEEEQKHYSETRRKKQVPGQPAQTLHADDGMVINASSSLPTDKTAYVKIGGHEFKSFVATSVEEQAVGLMNQPWPPPVMSFVYASPRINQFWMKNTPSPLDIVFALKGEVVAIKKGEPFSTQLIGDYNFSDLVIELPYGTCNKLGISAGDKVSFVNSSEDFVKAAEKKYL